MDITRPIFSEFFFIFQNTNSCNIVSQSIYPNINTLLWVRWYIYTPIYGRF